MSSRRSSTASPVLDLESLCVDPRPQIFEVTSGSPKKSPPGDHTLNVHMGRRKLAPVTVYVIS